MFIRIKIDKNIYCLALSALLLVCGEILKGEIIQENHEQVFIANKKGIEFYESGDYRKSILYFEEALYLAHKALPSDNKLIANIYENMGDASEMLSKYKEAQKYFMKALEIRKKYLKKEHNELFRCYRKLSYVLSKKESYQESLSYCTKGLVLSEKYSIEPLELAIIYKQSADIFFVLKNYEKAINYYQKALGKASKIRELDYLFRKRILSKIGIIYLYLENYNQSVYYLKKSFLIKSPKNKIDLKDTIMLTSFLIKAYLNQKKYKEALSSLQKTLKLVRKHDPGNNLEADIYNMIGFCYIQQKKKYEALEYYLKKELPIRIEKSKNKKENSNLADLYITIADIYYTEKDLKKSILYFRKAINLIDSMPHPDSKRKKKLIKILANVGSCYLDIGLYRSAISWLGKAEKMHTKEFSNNVNFISVYFYLGRSLFLIHNYALAVRYFKKAYELSVETYGPDDLKSQNIASYLKISDQIH